MQTLKHFPPRAMVTGVRVSNLKSKHKSYCNVDMCLLIHWSYKTNSILNPISMFIFSIHNVLQHSLSLIEVLSINWAKMKKINKCLLSINHPTSIHQQLIYNVEGVVLRRGYTFFFVFQSIHMVLLWKAKGSNILKCDSFSEYVKSCTCYIS